MDKDLTYPLVSIAIPFYNSEKFLKFSILSVINQTYTNWELLLIDDGGTDGSKRIAEGFAANDSRIKVLSDGKNKGLAVRLNESVLDSRGAFYARMDDDDIMAVDRIEKQVQYLMSHTNIDVVGASAMIIDDHNNIIRSSSMKDNLHGFIHPTVMGRTKWFVDNPYNVEYRRSQDAELWLRTNKQSNFYNIGEPLLFYREVGIPSLKKTLNSNRTLRIIYHNYKVYDKTLYWCWKMCLISRIKDIAYTIFSAINRTDYLIRMRKRIQLPESLHLSIFDLEKAIQAR